MGAIYAVLRNGMWDDPAVAATGKIAQEFERKSAEHGYESKHVAPYLTWRFSYLLCGLVFGLSRLIASYPDYHATRAKYTKFLAQLPNQVPADSFSTLTAFLAAYELGLWVTVLISFLLMVGATCASLPASASLRTRLSRRLLWSAWLVAFAPPFIVTLVCPMRSLVPWQDIVAEACHSSVMHVFNMPGSNLRQQLTLMENQGLLKDQPMSGLVGSVDTWCAEKGSDWHVDFYGVTVKCLWFTDDFCRSQLCVGDDTDNPRAGTSLSSCLGDCLQHVIKIQASMGDHVPLEKRPMEGYRRTFETCSANGSPPPSSTSLKAAVPKSIDGVSLPALYDFTALLQQTAVEDSSRSITFMTLQAEYVVGMLIGIVMGKSLVSAALSLLGGLGEGLINLKAMFPGSQAPGWIMILTTFEAVPVYVALLGVLNQLVGDVSLSVGCVLTALFLSLSGLTGARMLKFGSSDSERERLYRWMWTEYALRGALGVGIVVAVAMWMLRQDRWGLRDYVRESLLTPQVMVTMVLDVYSKKIVTAVAGTDAVLSAFVQAETWQASTLTGTSLDTHTTVLGSFSRLARGGDCTTATVSPSSPSATKMGASE